MLTTSNAWSSTLILKVYIAKLAVLISMPTTVTIHGPSEVLVQGLSRSLKRTPFSLAKLSNRIGINEAVRVW